MFDHALQGLLTGDLGIAELGDRVAVACQGGGGVVQAGSVLRWYFGRQRAQLGQGLVDGLQRRLLVVGVAAVGIAAYLEARLLQQGADFHCVLVLADIATLQQAALHPGNQLRGLVGSVAKHGAAGLAALAGLFQLVECLLIAAHGLALLLKALTVSGLLDLPEHELYLAVEVAQGLFQLCHRGFVRLALVMLAGDAQLLGVLLDDRDVPQLVAPVDDAVHAVPAGQGDGQCQQQHQAEAQPQFAIDAHIAQ